MERVTGSGPGAGPGHDHLTPPADGSATHLRRIFRCLAVLVIALTATASCSEERTPLAPPSGPPPAMATASAPGNVRSLFAAGMCLGIENGLAILASCDGAAARQFAFESDGTIRFDGSCLATSRADGRYGDRIIAATCTGAANQRWEAAPANEIRGINGYCIDVAALGTSHGTPIVVWPCHGGGNQKWSIEEPVPTDDDPTPTAPSGSTIESVHAAGMCLGIENGLGMLVPCGSAAAQLELDGAAIRYGASCLATSDPAATPGSRIIAATCTGAANQRWTPNQAAEIRGINDYCVDAAAYGTTHGTPIVVWPCHGGGNQRWKIDDTVPTDPTDPTDPDGNVIESLLAAGMCLGIENHVGILASCGSSAAGSFAFEGGSLRFGERCLATNNPTAPAGDRIIATTCSGAANQRWTPNQAGEIRGINDFCVDVAAHGTAHGTPIVVWTCHGGTNQRWDVAGDPPPPPPPGNGSGGEAYRGRILFTEPFDDGNLAARGWYDFDTPRFTSAEHAPGSAASFECRYSRGRTECDGGVPGRREFPEIEQLYVSYWVKYEDGWVGSGRPYHPHEFYFLSNLEDRYAGPAHTRLTLYIEQVGGTPRVALQDGVNVDTRCILRNDNVEIGCSPYTVETFPFGETRSVAACNGLAGPVDGRDCFPIGGGAYSSVRWWNASTGIADGGWHFVETYVRLNSISGGVGVADGEIRQWIDGAAVLNAQGVLFRTGEHPTLRLDQMLLGPYIGDGSPIDQTMWFDELTVAEGRRP